MDSKYKFVTQIFLKGKKKIQNLRKRKNNVNVI